MNLKDKLAAKSKKDLGLNEDVVNKNSFVSIKSLKNKYKEQSEFLNSLDNLDGRY